MYKTPDGYAFPLKCIATEDTLNDVASAIRLFVDKIGRYEPEAMYSRFISRINTAIISSGDQFQSLIEFLVPKAYSNCCLFRIRKGTNLDRLLHALEEYIADEHDGLVELDVLASELWGLTRDTISRVLSLSKSYIFINDAGSGSYQSYEFLGLPSDFKSVCTDYRARLFALEILPTSAVMNAVVSLHYGYNIAENLGLPVDFIDKISSESDEEV